SHLAWPEVFSGAALVAGGPYGCAGGKLETALGSCMKGEPAPDVGALAERTRQRARQGSIGKLSALAHSHVYVLHGEADALVAEPVARAAADLYENLRAADPDLSTMQ